MIGYFLHGGLTIILLHGVDPNILKGKILDGKSITIVEKSSKFYSSADCNWYFTNLAWSGLNQSSTMVVMIRFGYS